MSKSEQFLAFNDLTDNETVIVQNYIFLPVIRMALERDKKIIMNTKIKFNEQYVRVIDEALHRVIADMSKNKKQIFDQQIKMYRNDWFDYDVYVRGRLINVAYHKSIASDWIYERVKDYFE